jgi:polysaccharide export outer membrane protein
MADQGAAARNLHVGDCYVVHCPDVVELRVPGRPGLSGRATVGPDGQIDVGAAEPVRVEGQTPPEIARRVALATGTRPGDVDVRVAEFRSQHVYLLGQGVGVQRAVAYCGPETVLDLLKRVGGVMPGAAPNDVYVVRPHVLEDRPPEVFPINLRAVLSGKDPRQNIRVQPFDQVYIGETRPASLQKCIPPCVRPLYEAVCGLSRS